jgi:hypothetical protein
MFKIPIQDNIFNVEKLEFLNFLKTWVNACKGFNVQLLNIHGAGLADFKGIYFSKLFNQFINDTSILDKEINDNSEINLPSFYKLEELTKAIWNDEKEIIKQYGIEFNVDISVKANRKKLESKINKNRLNNASQGIPFIPESVMKISKKTPEQFLEVQNIANFIENEINNLISNFLSDS